MNKEEAIKAMQEGKKVTHRSFTDEEWMTMKDGKILTEEGYTHPFEEFWFWRKDPGWEKDYSLYLES